MDTDKKDMNNQNQQKGGSKAYDAQAKPWVQKPASDSATPRDAKADHGREHTSEGRDSEVRPSDSKSFAKKDDQRTSENSKN